MINQKMQLFLFLEFDRVSLDKGLEKFGILTVGKPKDDPSTEVLVS